MAPANLRFQGDPRRPSEAVLYNPSLFTRDEAEPDSFTLVSMLLGMAAMLLKMRAAVIGCVLCFILAIANTRGTDGEVKTLVSCGCLAAFAVFSTYLEPLPRGV